MPVGSPTIDHSAPKSLRHPWLPLLAMGGVVLLWGAGPVITKLITVHPMLGGCLRFGLSVPGLFLLVAMRGKRVGWSVFRTAALPGLAFGVNLMFVFATLQEATVAVLAITVALQPALLLVVAGPLLGERASPAQVGWTLVGVAATAGVILGAGDELQASGLGLALAIAALASFSVYFVLTRLIRSRTDVDPFVWMAAINVWAFVACLVPSLFMIRGDHFAELDANDWFWLLALAYLTGIAGHVLMSWAHGYLEASRSSLYLLGMNVFAVGLAWPVHDEPVTLVQVLAGLVVLVSVAAVIRLPSRPSDPAAPRHL